MHEYFKKNKWLCYALILGAIHLVGTVIFFGFQSDADTGGYVQLLEYTIQGNYELLSTVSHRILRPGGVLAALPLTYAISPFAALLIVNYIFYFLTIYFIYKIGQKILAYDMAAFFGVAFFISAFPLTRFGLAALTDMGAWFFYCVSLFFTLLFLETNEPKYIYWNGFLSGVGVLVKENGGVGIFFFCAALVLCNRYTWRQLLVAATRFVVPFLFPIVANQIVCYWLVQYTYYDWYVMNTKTYLKQSYTFMNLLKNYILVFGLGWIFFIIGAWRVYRNRFKKELFLALAIPSFSFLFWPSVTARLMYIAGPLLSIVAAYGFLYVWQQKKWLAYVGAAGVVLTSYGLVQLSYIL